MNNFLCEISPPIRWKSQECVSCVWMDICTYVSCIHAYTRMLVYYTCIIVCVYSYPMLLSNSDICMFILKKYNVGEFEFIYYLYLL